MSVIYLHSLFPISSSGLPSDVGRATLINAGLHDLTTPKMYSATCHHVPGGLLLHLLTLTAPKSGGYFLLHYSALADSFLLGSRMLYVARTFLFCHRHQRQTVRLLFCVMRCKVSVLLVKIKVFGIGVCVLEQNERPKRFLSAHLIREFMCYSSDIDTA